MSWMRTGKRAMQSRRARQAGLSLVELLIAMLVMAVGMMGSMILVRTAIVNNNRNKLDTASTALAQMVLEQISSRSSTLNTTFTVTDCSGTPRTINPTGAASPGAGATLLTSGFNSGNIDFSQALAVVPAGYAMQYTTCGPANQRVTYEIRWNVTTMTANTKLITVSARKQIASNTSALPYFSVPVTLRGIAGQ